MNWYQLVTTPVGVDLQKVTWQQLTQQLVKLSKAQERYLGWQT